MNGVLFIYDLISIFVSDPKKAATNWFVCEKDYFYRNATLILQFLWKSGSFLTRLPYRPYILEILQVLIYQVHI